MPRQLVRNESIRAPLNPTDQLNNASVKVVQSALDGAAPNADISNADLWQAVLSQLRDFQGGATWTDQAPPDPSEGHEQRFNEALVGAQDGVNLVFYAQFFFLVSTLTVYRNGSVIYPNTDYTVAESGGPGTGFDTITLINYGNIAPLPGDRLAVSYTRSGGPSAHTLP